MSLKCGIVGLPNVGKSTIFNAMTRSKIAAAANYPFCTIEPNVAIANVRDPRLKILEKIASPQRIVPAIVEFVDIAGLVEGASKGEGLGNQFLANIRETNAILHVTRCFHDDDIIHVKDRVSPIEDIMIVEIELCLADLNTIDKLISKQKKTAKSEKEKKWLASLLKVSESLNEGIAIRIQELSKEELDELRPYHLLTQKPVLYCANLDEASLIESPNLKTVTQLAEKQGAAVIALCATLEEEIACLSEEESNDFLKEMGMKESGLDQLIRTSFSVLGLHTYFTVGEKEVRSWMIPKGATAAEAAGVIHSDFEKNFIRAEVVQYTDFIELQGWAAARTAGKARLEGKTYIVNDGDIILFRTNP